MSNASCSGSHVLGLDIGANSLGWALIERDGGSPTRVIVAGVRVFDAGVEGQIERGLDQSRAVKRRQARLRRRQLARRSNRLTDLAACLQTAGLFPPGDISSPDALDRFLADFDCLLFPAELRSREPHVLHYRLRARALDEPLTPHELGRALYHLAQRRGFLSNRRAPRSGQQSDKDSEGKVKKDISQLARDIEAAGARTLGEYLSGLDPTQERIRSRYLGRAMLQEEFDAIWTAQSAHHPDLLNEHLHERVRRIIFFQRPLKVRKELIGRCELEPSRRRAPIALRLVQRFRLLDKVNNLRVVSPEGQVRELGPEQRKSLVTQLEEKGELSFARVRKLLGVSDQHRINLESGGDKKLLGNRTCAPLAKAVGKRWSSFADADKDRLIEDLRSIHNPDALKRRLTNPEAWAFDQATAEKIADIRLEDGYCSLSRQAIEKVLPRLEQGIPYATVRKELYGERAAVAACRALPALGKTVEIRNPAVSRALTEVRKVVNSLIARYGKPSEVRIELARDLQKSRPQRKRIFAQNNENRQAHEEARRFLQDNGFPNPSRRDREKYLLWKECREQCPYTGRSIGSTALFGAQPEFDVEHIIPFPRCLDDSFMNKTLCEVAENRNVKGKQTPWEAYGGDPAPPRWEDIIGRVRRFAGSARDAKLERFQLHSLESLDDFVSSKLNDTRYASRQAVEYLGHLYGARADGIDPRHKRTIRAGRGQVTAYLRNGWRLNEVLGGGEKTRDDHRQHLIDAIVVALTDDATIKWLSQISAAEAMGKLPKRLEEPWPGFLDQVRDLVERVIVSHRPSRKVNAALHEGTHYGKPRKDPDGKDCVYLRTRLEDLSGSDLDRIVDKAVAGCVKAKLRELGDKPPSEAFKDRASHPTFRSDRGVEIPVHKVRIRRYEHVHTIGEGSPYARHVKLGSNHHIEIIESKDKKDQPRWEGCVVSTYEAMRRVRAKEPVVRRDHGEGKRFLFSLAGGDSIELDERDGTRGVYVMRKISQTAQGYIDLAFVRASDARRKQDIQGAGDWSRGPVSRLRELNCRKVVVTPLGEVLPAND